jgi:hypothetical protein
MSIESQDNQKEVNLARRSLLTKGAVGAAVVTVAPGVLLHQTVTAEPRKEAGTSDVRWAC